MVPETDKPDPTDRPSHLPPASDSPGPADSSQAIIFNALHEINEEIRAQRAFRERLEPFIPLLERWAPGLAAGPPFNPLAYLVKRLSTAVQTAPTTRSSSHRHVAPTPTDHPHRPDDHA